MTQFETSSDKKQAFVRRPLKYCQEDKFEMVWTSHKSQQSFHYVHGKEGREKNK